MNDERRKSGRTDEPCGSVNSSFIIPQPSFGDHRLGGGDFALQAVE
jgi:hypothetical protein